MTLRTRLRWVRGTAVGVSRDFRRRLGPPRPGRPAAACSWELSENETVARMLDAAPRHPMLADMTKAELVYGWGRRRSGRRAAALAARHGLPLALLEDGPLRSIGRRDPTLSVIVDGSGVYYDAGAPCDLEAEIAAAPTPERESRGRALVAAWAAGRVSKYNGSPEYAGALPPRYVLAVDQVAEDLSIRCGLADAGSFRRMLDAALEENPDCTVVLKVHPDARESGKKGHFDLAALEADPRVLVIADACHPVRLIAGAEKVYAVTSQMGFEALMHGKPVRCFGMPFYAGWGLTEDALPRPARRCARSLPHLTEALLARITRWRDPETGAPCGPERVIAHVARHRALVEETPAPLCAIGFSPWKRPILKRFCGGLPISDITSPAETPPGGTLLVWGAREVEGLPEGATLIRIEDGFLRSRGLGAHLTLPLAWAFDDQGIYYDPARPSRLESILQSGAGDAAMHARAAALRDAILAARLSKYNLGGRDWRRPQDGRRVVLAPGQVQADASIRFGAVGVNTNLQLVQEARRLRPDAYIVYKPHPDVVAGLRREGKDEARAAEIADEVVTDADTVSMLGEVDEVHTMTSLLGFEALLRGVPVTCHGQPFYSGWGLTTDMHPHPRRTARLTLDALCAGALILYPRYVSLHTGRFTTPERIVEELRDWTGATPYAVPAWRRAAAWALARGARALGRGKG